MMVQSAREAGPKVLEAAISTAKSIPFRKKDAIGLSDIKGVPQVKYIPVDLDRRYDEATFKVYDHARRMGHRIPKVTTNGQAQCIDTPLMGEALGFAFGLQYDFRKQGKCYINIETSLLALYNLY